MKLAVSRLMALVVMLLVVGAAFGLKAAGFEHAELDALLAAGLAAVLTVAVTA